MSKRILKINLPRKYIYVYIINFFAYQITKRSHPKKITVLADMSAKALSPPPQGILTGRAHEKKCDFFSSCIKVYV